MDETNIRLVRVGQEAVLTLDAYADEPFRGAVRHIAYEAQTVNNVTIYEVEIEPAAVPERMKSGMTATVKFIVEAADDALTLPLDALVREDGRSVVLACLFSAAVGVVFGLWPARKASNLIPISRATPSPC